MAYPVSQLIQSFLDQAGAADMLTLFKVLASKCPVNFHPRDISAMADDLADLLAESSERERVRQAYFNLLTDREIDVLALLAAGHSYQFSAKALGISKRTLRQHLENIKRKLAIQPHHGESHVTTRQVIAHVFSLDTMQRIG